MTGMKVKILAGNVSGHAVGDVVDKYPADAAFLTRIGAAEAVAETANPKPAKNGGGTQETD
ncbi:MAG: hypothetical protein OXC29_24120 [Rhodococcus sp.]|nr:hypothetical protein [Rhodococcus sp. (in: high G+C Gram-positive bacteria)]